MASFKPLARKTRAGSSCVTTDAKACDIGSVMQGGRHSLLSSTANVGTKMVVAKKCDRFDTVGIDLVALCANHLAARGAEPLFFNEHLSTEKLDAHQAMELVKGVADGCVEAGCALIDTGVSELPGIIAPGGSDFVGFAVGAVEPEAVLPNVSAMKGGDVLIALPASGMHSNGFALIRCIIRAAGLEYSQAAPFDPTRSLGDALLPASRIYVKPVLSVAREGLLLGAAQVASGGLARCFDEVLPSHLAAHLRGDAWELPVALRWLAAVGKIRSRELSSTFNCGLGMVLVVAQESVDRVMHLLRDQREEPVVVGELVARAQGAQRVEIEGADGAWLMLPELGVSLPFPEVLSSLQDPWTVSRMRVVVLAGPEDVTSVQALVQATSLPASAAVLAAVVSADPNSHALRVARSAGVASQVLGDGRFTEAGFFCDGLDDLDAGSNPDSAAGADSGGGPGINASADFSAQLDHAMESLQAELLVVLDDVDPSLLTRSFLTTHEGRVAVLHASLLPSFPGALPVEAALRSGVCITGCTMCFAVPPVSLGPGRFCYGPQILQETCRITGADTAATLRARLVSQCESYVLPRAVQLIASGSVALQLDGGGYGLGRSDSFTEAASEGLLGTSHKAV
uniref:phosphoribosylformylglycinamidine cyclo-ligase n=1 Tax=Alexandrium catenella TaxID=2925 RepID=A0A7S1WXV0_ALECA